MGSARSKRLSYREEVLKMAHALHDALAGDAGRRGAGVHTRVDQVLEASFEAKEVRRIDAVRQVDADGPDGRTVANPEAHRVNHVIEILKRALVHAEREIAEAGIGVSGVMKQHAGDIVADQREAQLDLIEQDCRAPQREAGYRVARSGLVFREAAVRSAAAAEKAFRQGDGVEDVAGIAERVDVAEFRAARQHQLLADGMVGRIARQKAQEVALRTDDVLRQPHVQRGVEAFMRIHGVVAAVLNEAAGDQTQAHRLREKRDQKRGDLESRLVDADAAIGVTVEQRGGFGDSLRQLRRAFFALIGERANVVRILIEAGEGDVEALLVAEAWPGVGEQAAAFQRGNAGAQADAVGQTPQVRPREIERYARGEARSEERRVGKECR